MKVAIPVFQNRVSPVFDWSTRLLVIETDQGCEIRREELTLSADSATSRIDSLAGLSIEVLLCGGISAPLFALVRSRGIRVVPWISGEVNEVIPAFLKGKIPGKGFYMPGCCGKRFRQSFIRRNQQQRSRNQRGPDRPRNDT
ncbi:MAG: NifB/NifX family molybdenum-iron cluster-binding protein [Planctomycetota bacterium]